MAKIVILKNVFDTSDFDEYEIKERKTVEDFINETGITDINTSNTVEIYDAETGETYFESEGDLNTSELLVNIIVNGEEKEKDYIIQDNDNVFITILPASKKGVGTALSIIGAAIVATAFVATMIISGGTAGVFWGLTSSVWVGIGLGGLALLGLGALLIDVDAEENKTNSKQDDAEKNPTISGSQNQPLGSNTFPHVFGTVECSPFIIGSPYNDFEYSETFDKTWLGSTQIQTLLLLVGYAPLYIENIKLENLPLMMNPNKVFSGLITESNAKDQVFNGKALSTNEIGSTWNKNDFEIEISQFNQHRTIYPFTVKQMKVNATCLYCYDNKYKTEAGDVITWQGGTFPTGLRTNTIKFSEAIPYKVSVVIDMPNGLYRHHTEDSDHYYEKIPMDFAIQWRPVYKIIDERNLNSDGEGSPTYNNKAQNPEYNEDRYTQWRNFDDNKIVKKIPYSGKNKNYYTYKINGKTIVYKDEVGFFISASGYVTDINNIPPDAIWKTWKPYNISSKGIYDIYYAEKNGQFTAETKRVWGQYKNAYNCICYGYINQATGYYIYEGKRYNAKQRNQICDNYANTKKNQITDLQYFWDDIYSSYENRTSEGVLERKNDSDKIINNYQPALPVVINSVSVNEVNANYGLSTGTSTDCNPNWSGVDCFAFGKYSCGAEAYKKDSFEPAINPKSASFKNVDGAKDQMSFEISATLTQEDILDLLNLNPKTNKIMQKEGHDNYKVLTDCIQVRVVRLTPCYINKKKSDYDYDYSDVTKWTTMKTYCLDGNKLREDMTTKECDMSGNVKEFSKINIDYDTLGQKNEDGYTWNNWNIDDYRLKPLSDEDQSKLCTIAIKCKADKLGYVTNSLKRVGVKARAITPALKEGFIRYWYTENEKHYYVDSYDNVSTVVEYNESENKSKYKDDHEVLVPAFNKETWILDQENLFDLENVKQFYDTNIYYEVRDNEWDSLFFPERIELKKNAEFKVDSENNPINDPDHMVEMVRAGNSWNTYMFNEMSKYKDSLERWRATESFLSTFTEQNSISQLLGLMVGSALGKDAKCYNSTPAKRCIRFWTKKEEYKTNEDGSQELYRRYYMYYDSKSSVYDSSLYIPEVPEYIYEIGEWNIGTYEEYAREKQYQIPSNPDVEWSYRVLEDDFNMQTVKESYSYTNAIDLGKGPLKWRYNQYLYNATKLETLMGQILVAALGYWTYDEQGRYEFINDRPLCNPVLMITDENCLSSSFTRRFEKHIAGYHLTFNDENNAFATGEVYALMNGQSKEHHTRDIVDLNLTGFTDGTQAQSYAFYLLAQAMLQKEIWSFKLNHVGQRLKIGSLINVQSLTLMIGTDNSGRIIKLIEDDNYIYGFIIDNIYDYRCEYKDGKNVQGCQIMQAEAQDKDRIITVRMANEEQQSYGFTITERGQTITYRNLKGQTNCVLLEKKIIKDKKRLVDQDKLVEEEDLNVTNITNYMPSVGDVVAFGNVGHISSNAVVISLSYDEKSNVSGECYPYNEGLYSCCKEMPTFISNITRKSRTADVPLKETVSYAELEEKVNEAKADVKRDMDIGDSPDIPVISAKAYRDYIELNYTLDDSLIKNSISNIEWTIIKGAKEVKFNSSGNTKYFFDRTTDGYPESTDIDSWKLKATVTNIWGKTSKEGESAISTLGYGTWIVNNPEVMTRVSDRTITLLITQPTMSNLKELYGTVRYKISVKRFDDIEFFCPATTANPYDSEFNYKDTEAEKDYLVSNNVYTQCMSLRNTDEEGKDIGLVDTLYQFKIVAFNECSESDDPVIVNETALCSSIRDIVKANETAKQAYISNLSAISADLGVIKAGSMTGNENNYWALSNIAAEEGHRGFKQGEFRVGSETQYIKFDPEKNKMDIKADIEIEGDFANIRGELAVYPVKDEYKLSEDTVIDPLKKYYTRSGENPNYVYTYVAEPTEAELLAGLYYEKMSGSESGLLPALQVLPNEADKKRNQTTVNGYFMAKDTSYFGTSTVDELYIRQFLEIKDAVKIKITY